MALANSQVPPRLAPYEHVAPAWLMLGPMPPPPPDRNKGMVGGKPVQPASQQNPGPMRGQAPTLNTAPRPLVAGGQGVQSRATPATSRPHSVQASAQHVHAPFKQAARTPVLPFRPGRPAQPTYMQPAQIPHVQSNQVPARAPPGHFIYTQAPTQVQHSIPRTVPTPLAQTTSMVAPPPTDVNGSFSVAAWTGIAQPVVRAQSFHGYPQTGVVHPPSRAGAQAYAPPTMVAGRGHPGNMIPTPTLKHRIEDDDEIQEIPPPHYAKRFKRH